MHRSSKTEKDQMETLSFSLRRFIFVQEDSRKSHLFRGVQNFQGHAAMFSTFSYNSRLTSHPKTLGPKSWDIPDIKCARKNDIPSVANYEIAITIPNTWKMLLISVSLFIILLLTILLVGSVVPVAMVLPSRISATASRAENTLPNAIVAPESTEAWSSRASWKSGTATVTHPPSWHGQPGNPG